MYEPEQEVDEAVTVAGDPANGGGAIADPAAAATAAEEEEEEGQNDNDEEEQDIMDVEEEEDEQEEEEDDETGAADGTNTTNATTTTRKRTLTGQSGGTTTTTTAKRRPVLPGSKKRGIPKGTKIASNKKLDDWYAACQKFEQINQTRKVSQAMFLRSEESGPLFTGKVSEQQSFGRYLIKYKNGELKPTAKKRHYPRKYEDIETKVIQYMDLRRGLYKRDKTGASWTLFRTMCQQWAQNSGHADFRVTPGWVSETLKRYDRDDVRWDTGGGDEDNSINNNNTLAESEREAIMLTWRKELEDVIEDHNLTLEDVYNADQMNLFYQKLPNALFVQTTMEATKQHYEGAKAMKDTNSITLMLCTSAAGRKVPLAIAGRERKPECFQLTADGKTPPISYTYQSNGWFDHTATLWWITHVFWPHHRRTRGDVPALLLFDPCSAHQIDETKLPSPKLIIKFLPARTGYRHQPLDMGVLSAIRVGYKHTLLASVLKLFDVEGGYELAAQQRKHQSKGCKGLNFGTKPHILDAMNILKDIWEQDTRYSRERVFNDVGVRLISYLRPGRLSLVVVSVPPL
jgi:hypothetical protein